MPCPFPGMDPYIERPAIWPDFHDRLITYICAALRPALRPRYAALTQDRLYVVEATRPIYPDIAIVPTRSPAPASPTPTALLEAEAPAVFDLDREIIRQPLIHIIEPAAGNKLITAVEILSPDNKASGEGRESYLKKRDEVWASGANLVEIDLLRAGETTARVSDRRLESLRPWHYLVLVTRRTPPRQEVYAIPLQRRLPRVAIPLASDDKDVILDLHAPFTRCWDEGPYPELLGYAGQPSGRLPDDELAWCEEQLRVAGYRPSAAGT